MTPFLLVCLVNQRLVDVRDHTSAGNGRLDQCIQLLISANSQLEVAGGDTLNLEILGGVTSELQDFSRQVLQDRCGVNRGRRSYTLAG